MPRLITKENAKYLLEMNKNKNIIYPSKKKPIKMDRYKVFCAVTGYSRGSINVSYNYYCTASKFV